MPTAQTADDAALIAFLGALPECETVEALLRVMLEHALALTGSTGGVALVARTPPTIVHAGGPDRGLTAQAQTVLAQILAPQDPAAPHPAPPDSPSDLYLPLATADGICGLLALRGGRTEASEPLRLIVRAAARILQLQLGLSRASQHLSELVRLYEVAMEMGTTLELPALLKLVVQRTQTLARSESCTLLLLDADTQEMVFEIASGGASVPREGRFPLGEGLAAWVATTGSPAIVNNPAGDPRCAPDTAGRPDVPIRNILAVPLPLHERVGGVLEVRNTLDGAPYTDHDLDVLTTLAGQAALALGNAQLYHALRAGQERLFATEEEVRKELARDLHDGPAQQIAAVCMEIEHMRTVLALEPKRLPGELDALERLARQANRQVRTLQFQLRPVLLEAQGLRAAIDYYLLQLRETERLALVLEATGCTGRLPWVIEQAAFGVVQEALGNVRKHARAQQVTVTMLESADQWQISIADDGRGFDLAAVLGAYALRGSLGLLSMRERAESIGGALEIASTPGQGTTVTLTIPAGGEGPRDE